LRFGNSGESVFGDISFSNHKIHQVTTLREGCSGGPLKRPPCADAGETILLRWTHDTRREIPSSRVMSACRNHSLSAHEVKFRRYHLIDPMDNAATKRSELLFDDNRCAYPIASFGGYHNKNPPLIGSRRKHGAHRRG